MSRAISFFTAAVMVAAIGACFTGPSAKGFEPATSPHGIQARVRLPTGDLEGELLEVRDTAFVIAATDGISVVHFLAVRDAKFPKFSAGYHGGLPGGEAAAQLRPRVPFPRGVAPGPFARPPAPAGRSAPPVGGPGVF